MYLPRIKAPALLLLIMMLPALVSAASVYETQTEFLDRAFSGSPPEPDVIWLSGDRKLSVREILGHNYPALRLRYWCAAGRSAWVVEEIGKELPITVGVIIAANYIKSLQVLTYRENRGEEVVTPAFSDQFIDSTLDTAGKLDKNIDGISGATLSVQALTRLATMSLFLHNESGCQDGA
jgi:hypothetical protein